MSSERLPVGVPYRFHTEAEKQAAWELEQRTHRAAESLGDALEAPGTVGVMGPGVVWVSVTQAEALLAALLERRS